MQAANRGGVEVTKEVIPAADVPFKMGCLRAALKILDSHYEAEILRVAADPDRAVELRRYHAHARAPYLRILAEAEALEVGDPLTIENGRARAWVDPVKKPVPTS